LYSLGVVAFEVLSGQRPFQAETPLDALTQRLTSPPRPLRSVAAQVAPDLALVVNRCLEKEPKDRWPNATSLGEALLPEDDAEDPQLVRVLRTIVTIVLPVGMLVLFYLALVAEMHRDSPVFRVERLLMSGLAGPAIVAVVLAIRLRRLGFDTQTII